MSGISNGKNGVGRGGITLLDTAVYGIRMMRNTISYSIGPETLPALFFCFFEPKTYYWT